MKKNYIALGGLFACMHVLFLIVSKIIVGSELLLVLFLPLLSTIYTLKCDKKSVLMFVIATLLICFVFDFVSTFIYVVPSLICGIMYGFLRKKKFKELELLCVSGLTHMVSILFSFLIIVLLFKEVDFMAIFEQIFSLSGDNLFVVALLTLFVLGFCEAFLVHIISDNELEKLATKVEKNDSVPKWFAPIAGISLASCFIVYFINSLYSVFPMLLFFMFFIPYIIAGIINLKYKVLTTVLCVLFSFVAIFVIQFLNPIMYLILPIFISSPLVINNFKDNTEKIF